MQFPDAPNFERDPWRTESFVQLTDQFIYRLESVIQHVDDNVEDEAVDQRLGYRVVEQQVGREDVFGLCKVIIHGVHDQEQRSTNERCENR